MITIDSNVLVYARDDRDPAKQATAGRVITALAGRGSWIGLQCVGEVHVSLRRKLRLSAWVAAEEARALLAIFPTFQPTEKACLAALELAATARHGYWDSLLIASAVEAGCRAMLTEDAQASETVAGLELVNPFGPQGRLSARAAEMLDL